MAFKKHDWIELKRNGIMFEMIVRDEDFKKLETKKFTPQNFEKAIKDIGNRYGINRKMQTLNKEVQDEIDWMTKEGIL